MTIEGVLLKDGAISGLLNTFLDLTDTPGDYTGHKDELVGIKHTPADGLEFKNITVLGNALGINTDNMGLGLGGGQTGGYGQIVLYGRDYAGVLSGSVDLNTSNAAESGMALALQILGATNTPSVDIQHTLKTDTIVEKTAANGIEIDQFKALDTNLIPISSSSYMGLRGGAGADNSFMRVYGENHSTSAGNIEFYVLQPAGPSVLKVMSIECETDVPAILAEYPVFVDTICENTVNAGVTVDGFLIKDGEIDGGTY